MDRYWRPLPVAPHADVPPLLVAAAFDAASSSYSVAVTDLAHIWSESLDRRGICMRAFHENTTIDPSYDSEQMGVFLGKIRSALDVRGDPDSSLALASSGDDLVLHVSCALPGGLPPLEWPLHLTLSSGPSSSVSSSLVRPLVKDRARSQRSTAALMAALRQKDAVIAKLVDKLDAVGAGAESAFLSLLPSSGGSSARRAGGSRVSRADMERRIKGLAPFDEAAFRRQCREQEDARDDDASTASLVSTFGELPCGEADSLAEDKPWWQSLGSGKVALTRIASATDSQDTLRSEGQSKPSPQGEEEEDGFQTTPSRAAKTTDPVADAPSPTPARTRDTDTLRTPSKSSKPKGLGKIGAGKKKVGTKEEKEEENTAPKPASLPVDVDEDATASEAENEMEEEEEEEEKKEKEKEKRGKEPEETKAEEDRLETVATVRPKSARGGLGRIGGKKEKEKESKGSKESKDTKKSTELKESEKEVDKQTEPETDENDSAKRKAESKSPAASKTPPLPPVIAETKRAEILQQAVAKNAAPVRKKRKF